jgi:hypothetical protein
LVDFDALAIALLREEASWMGVTLSEACRRFCDVVDFIKSRKFRRKTRRESSKDQGSVNAEFAPEKQNLDHLTRAWSNVGQACGTVSNGCS